jgi:transcription termination/antitermination protein NusG
MPPNKSAIHCELKLLSGTGSPQRENLPWYALRIQSKLADVALAVLRDKGYETFMPRCTARRLWSDRVKKVELPLFPGYLFCRFELHDRLSILTTPGMISIVGAGRIPIAVEDHEITAIRLILRAGLAAQSRPFLASGSRAYVESGPLAGVEGILTNSEKGDQLVVSINLLQRSIAVVMDRNWVRTSSINAGSPAVMVFGHGGPVGIG